RDWHEPLETGRTDEIGRLARAIESMRQRLVRQDKAQQFFLQNISHELKTPVMVIRSYVQSIRDNIFPKGTLEGSLDIISKESERLERRIRDLLLLNKLNYLAAHEKPSVLFSVKPIMEDAIERLRYRRADVTWELNMADAAQLHGDQEQWAVAIENLLDNQLRYAESTIHITVDSSLENVDLKTESPMPVIRISNDGPPLDQALADSLFEPFRVGAHGEFGLGLAIVRQIAVNHGMTVRAANEADAVAFYLEPNFMAASEATQRESTA
ncbi:MAG: histidine kinase, partial [Paenibacillus sp.]|nr:histidine kinase [Paenibacillus sp.]